MRQSRDGGADPLAYVPLPAETARLVLEVLTPGHAPRLIDGLRDPVLYTWLDRAPPDLSALTLRFRTICHRPAPDGQLWLNWALRVRADGRYVGLAEATVYPNREANLAYFVFSAEQGSGFAVEACAAVIGHLQRDCGVMKVIVTTDTRNTASQRVAEKLGFVRAVDAEPAGRLRGMPVLDYRYSLCTPR
jgi:[ribosomal protein S5]-alanine N-acetyltransferase